VTYHLDQTPTGATYRIEASRYRAQPVCIIGSAEDAEGRLPNGNWSRSPELDAVRGLIRTRGTHVHAVVYKERQAIHLIGYTSEAEIVRVVKSLRRVTSNSKR